MVQYGTKTYSSPDQRMVETQANIISSLNKQIETLKRDVIDLEKMVDEYKPNHDMYAAICKAVGENPPLQEIWDELVVTMRLLGVKF